MSCNSNKKEDKTETQKPKTEEKANSNKPNKKNTWTVIDGK